MKNLNLKPIPCLKYPHGKKTVLILLEGNKLYVA